MFDPATWGTIASIGGSILGGLTGKQKRGPSPEDLMSIESNAIGNRMRATMDYAQKYGIHPIYALGGNAGAGGSTISIGGGESSGDRYARMADMGQNIGSALQRISSKEERIIAAKTAALGLEHGELQNELLRSQIAQMRAGMAPGTTSSSNHLIPGQGDVLTIPKEIIANTGSDEKGVSPSRQHMNYKGKLIHPMSSALSDAGMDEGVANTVYQLFNVLPQMLAAETENILRQPGKMRAGFSKWRQSRASIRANFK